MDKSENSILQIQELEREILCEFIRICQEHDLRYFMAEGSLLGAVRHQGMIPWDDDIDVAMFREDYERFLQIAPDAMKPEYELQSHLSHSGYKDCMAKMINRNRYVRSFTKKEPFVTNVWMDIFVIDGFPTGRLAGKIHKVRLLAAKLMLMWSDVDYYATGRDRPFHETIMIQVARKLHFSKWINAGKWHKRLEWVMASIPVRQNGNTVNFISEYRFRTVVPYSAYGFGRESNFDGMTVIIPEFAEIILSQIYGDYMTPPPENIRYKHQLELLPVLEKTYT